MEWKLQEAKGRFSELVRRAISDGAQTVTRHGEEVVVVIPVAEYRELVRGREVSGFREFLAGAPDIGGLDISRDRSPSRMVELDGEG